MKKIAIVAAASASLMSSAAFAQSNTDLADLVVSGTVQQECSIADPTPVNFSVVNINEGAGETALRLKNGSQADTQSIYVSCNYGASLSAESAKGGLFNEAGTALAANDPDDFTNLIHYRVKLTATDSSFPVLDYRTRLEALDTVLAPGAFHNNATLEVRIDADDTKKRPVAGAYADTTTLTIGVI